MEFRDIPAVDEHFYDRMLLLRGQISNAVAEDVKASAQRVEKTLDNILPDTVLEHFGDWPSQKPDLEENLIETFLSLIVPITMEPERGNGQLYQYSLYSEGWCLHPSHRSKPHFIKGRSIANNDFYTLDELVENWQDIFVRDVYIDENLQLSNSYAPRHGHNDSQTLGVLVTTRHELRIVDSRGRHVPGTTISYARTKAGVRHLFKISEWLTDRKPDGSSRPQIDDYMAALSRVPDESKTWIYAMQIVEDMSKIIRGDLGNVLRLQRYTYGEAEELRSGLEQHPEVGGFVSGRSDLYFDVEKVARGIKNDRRFGEILIPHNGNKISYQIYNDDDYTKSEGVPEQRHDRYREAREREITEGFTPWHWSIMRRLSPFFASPGVIDKFREIYEPFLSLDYLGNGPVTGQN